MEPEIITGVGAADFRESGSQAGPQSSKSRASLFDAVLPPVLTRLALKVTTGALRGRPEPMHVRYTAPYIGAVGAPVAKPNGGEAMAVRDVLASPPSVAGLRPLPTAAAVGATREIMEVPHREGSPSRVPPSP